MLKPQTTNQNIIEMVDRFGQLSAELKTVDDLIKERDTRRKQLADYADTISEGEVKLSGFRYYVSFSKAPLMGIINNIGGFLGAVGLENLITAVQNQYDFFGQIVNSNAKSRLAFISG